MNEWLGTLRIGVPGVEQFEGECDSDGNIVVTAALVLAHVANADQLRELCGEAQEAAYAAFAAAS